MTNILKDFPSIASLRSALDDHKISSVELTQVLFKEIAAQSELNAFVDLNQELSLAQAKTADQTIAAGHAQSLTGIPIAHKDIFVTKGWHTTAGSNILKEYKSPFDSHVVEQLIQAGTVSLGKLNCDEFAMGSGNEHSAFGPAHNPWHPKVVPGGSSGGSAAAVAAGLVMAATGTDTGGSVRQPASLCGISGIKPTYGTISRYGMVAYASSLDQAGPMARSAHDLMLMLDVMSGFDTRDATSIQTCRGVNNQNGRVKHDFTQHSLRIAQHGAKPFTGLRIGVPEEYFGPGLDNNVAQAVTAAIDQFEALGAQKVSISLPHTRLSIPAYYVIAPAEASSNLARYDAIRYGHRTENYTDLADMTARSRSEGFGAEVQRRIMVGTYVLSHGYYDAYYLQAQRIRRLIAEDYQAVLGAQCDVIMGPVNPTVAPPIGEKNQSPTAEWLADIYTLSLNLAGLPGMSIPCGFAPGFDGQALPVGLQLIGNYFEEGQLLALAHQFQLATDWHLRRPEPKTGGLA